MTDIIAPRAWFTCGAGAWGTQGTIRHNGEIVIGHDQGDKTTERFLVRFEGTPAGKVTIVTPAEFVADPTRAIGLRAVLRRRSATDRTGVVRDAGTGDEERYVVDTTGSGVRTGDFINSGGRQYTTSEVLRVTRPPGKVRLLLMTGQTVDLGPTEPVRVWR